VRPYTASAGILFISRRSGPHGTPPKAYRHCTDLACLSARHFSRLVRAWTFRRGLSLPMKARRGGGSGAAHVPKGGRAGSARLGTDGGRRAGRDGPPRRPCGGWSCPPASASLSAKRPSSRVAPCHRHRHRHRQAGRGTRNTFAGGVLSVRGVERRIAAHGRQPPATRHWGAVVGAGVVSDEPSNRTAQSGSLAGRRIQPAFSPLPAALAQVSMRSEHARAAIELEHSTCGHRRGEFCPPRPSGQGSRGPSPLLLASDQSARDNAPSTAAGRQPGLATLA